MPLKSWVYRSIKVGLARAEYEGVLSLANLFSITETAMARRILRNGISQLNDATAALFSEDKINGGKHAANNSASFARHNTRPNNITGQAGTKNTAAAGNLKRLEFRRLGGRNKNQEKCSRKVVVRRDSAAKKRR